MLFSGDSIVVTGGAFEGMPGMIYEVKNHKAKVGIHLFGQNMTIEMPMENLCKRGGLTRRSPQKGGYIQCCGIC